jgi:hypothetical protein
MNIKCLQVILCYAVISGLLFSSCSSNNDDESQKGQNNKESKKVETPIFTPDEGLYDDLLEVTIQTATEDAKIFYTTDESEPLIDNGIEYEQKITLESTTTLKAIAVKENWTSSDIAKITYLINNWQILGDTGEFTDGSLDFLNFDIAGDVPYLTYRDNTGDEPSFGVKVQKYDGSNWISVGESSLTTEFITYPNIQVYNGVPYLAYNAYSSGTGGLASIVKKFDGESWVDLGNPDFTPGETDKTVFKVDQGIPFLGFQDTFNADKATVMKYENNSWELVGDAGFTSDAVGYFVLEVDNGVPYIAFEDAANSQKLSVMKFNGSTWEYLGDPGISDGSTISSQTIKVSNEIAYIAFFYYSDNDRLRVLKYDGVGWISLNVTALETERTIWGVAIDIYNDILYIAVIWSKIYGLTSFVSVYKYENESWMQIGESGFISGETVSSESLIFSDGIPYFGCHAGFYFNPVQVAKYTY